MIETKESLAEFEKRRERAREAMRCAIRGELPFSNEKKETDSAGSKAVIVKSNVPVTLLPQCPVCEDRKRKTRERVKRYRSKK